MTERRFFDNTILSSYKKCPRFYFLRHVKHWRRDGTAMPLVFGLSWHNAMDVVWRHAKQVPLTELVQLAAAQFDQTFEEQGCDPTPSLENQEKYGNRNPGVAREMLAGYVAERRNVLQSCELIAVEQPFAVPLPIDNSSPVSIWYAGRLDKVAAINGEKVVVEHKSTSEYAKIGGFKPAYVTSWYMDSQVMGYLYGGGLYYKGLEQVWVDAALVHKTVHDKFRFIPVGHQWGMLESWIEDTKEWVRRLLRDESIYRSEGLLPGLFPKQQEQCVGKYGPCPMLDICRTQQRPDELTEPPHGYIYEEWVPFDILKLEKIFNDKETQSGKKEE